MFRKILKKIFGIHRPSKEWVNVPSTYVERDTKCDKCVYDVKRKRRKEHTFGIYTDKDKAEAAKKVVIKQLYEKEKGNEWSYVDDISDIEVSVVEIESDMAVDIELGGYCE